MVPVVADGFVVRKCPSPFLKGTALNDSCRCSRVRMVWSWILRALVVCFFIAFEVAYPLLKDLV